MAETESKPTLLDRLQAFVFPRMGLWLWLTIGLMLLIWFLAPHMVKVAVYKLSMGTIGAYAGYWLSRTLERGVRPHELEAKADALIGSNEQIIGMSLENSQHLRENEARSLRARANSIQWRRIVLVAVFMLVAALGS